MCSNIGYIRASENRHDAKEQRDEIVAYGKSKNILITSFVEVPFMARRSSRRQRIDELCVVLESGDNLIVADLNRLGRSTGEIGVLLNHLLEHGVTVTVIRQDLVLQQGSGDAGTTAIVDMLARFAAIEREFTSVRTKQVLAVKKENGVQLGKPKGTIQASMYDKDRAQIEALLRLGVSQRRILTVHLGYGTPNSLSHYIRTRGLAV